MPRPVQILLVEDNPGDVRLTEEALKESAILYNLTVAKDGEEAIECLYHRGKYIDHPDPELIFLDLNLPKKDGREVLRTIKYDQALSPIPIIILTTSRSEEDILTSYQLHANCYITKPMDIRRFIDIIKSTQNYWLNIVKLPTRAGVEKLD
jgi:two-component system response regulator